MAKVNYARVWVGSKNSVKKAWVVNADSVAVTSALQEHFGKNYYSRRPSAAVVAASEAKPAAKAKATVQAPAVAA